MHKSVGKIMCGGYNSLGGAILLFVVAEGFNPCGCTAAFDVHDRNFAAVSSV